MICGGAARTPDAASFASLRYYLYLLLTAVLWGSNYHLAKYMVAETTFAGGGFWRYAVAVATLLLVVGRGLPNWATVRRHLGPAALIGGVALFGFNLCYFLGLGYTSALNGSLIMSLNPASTVLLSAALLGTAVRPLQVVGLVVSLAGVAYLVTAGEPSRLSDLDLNRGDLCFLGANVCFAFHHVWVKRYGGGLSTQHFTLLIAAFTFAAFLVALTVTGYRPSLDHTPTFWGCVLAFGALGTTLAYLSWNAGVKALGADVGGMFLNVPPLATALGAAVLGQPFLREHYVAGGLVLTGLLIGQWSVYRARGAEVSR